MLVKTDAAADDRQEAFPVTLRIPRAERETDFSGPGSLELCPIAFGYSFPTA